jgi:hypothetical protein
MVQFYARQVPRGSLNPLPIGPVKIKNPRGTRAAGMINRTPTASVPSETALVRFQQGKVAAARAVHAR